MSTGNAPSGNVLWLTILAEKPNWPIDVKIYRFFCFIFFDKIVIMFFMENIENSKLGKRLSISLVLLCLILSFAAGIILGSSNILAGNRAIIRGIDPSATSTYGTILNKDGEIPDYLTKDVDFNLFWDVWNVIKDKYYEKDIPETQLFYGAVAGLVGSLRDPYSVFMTAQDTDEFQEELNGNFEGIGAEIGIRGGKLTVIAPINDSPAMQAGLRAKDIILKIDDLSTDGLSLDKAVDLIRGEKGTEVILTIYRDSFSEPREIKIVRGDINVKSLSWELRNDGIFYIKVRQFNGATIPLLNEAVIEILKQRNITGIILDLRYNPGGYLQGAIDMAGEWANGQPVVLEKSRDGQELSHSSNKNARLADYKTVVLVNSGTASGSEIVAGALQDYGLATIVGETTFGKGSVQEMLSLRDNSSIKITIAKWFTPNGRSIDLDGIVPDVEVLMSEEDYDNFADPQLDKAVEILNAE